LAAALARRSRVGFVCDTAEQAEEVAKLAAQALPKHRRMALERAAAGAWGVA